MANNKEKLSYGEAKHRRRELAKERRSVEYLRQAIFGMEQARERAEEIEELLNTDNLSPRDRTLYTIEMIWAKSRAGEIDLSERQSGLARILNDLEKKWPDIYKELNTPDKEGITLVRRISNRFFPPPRR